MFDTKKIYGIDKKKSLANSRGNIDKHMHNYDNNGVILVSIVNSTDIQNKINKSYVEFIGNALNFRTFEITLPNKQTQRNLFGYFCVCYIWTQQHDAINCVQASKTWRERVFLV